MLTPKFASVAKLAQALGRHIAVYDLEATAFRGAANFGITEVSVLLVAPDGFAITLTNLINPERSISPEAVALNGITTPMVADKETWGRRYAELFEKFSRECYVCGFNNHTFDNHAVRDMNERYGRPFEKFHFSFDIRNLFRKLAGVSASGGLSVVGRALNVEVPDGLHRAEADVALTAAILDALVELYGLDAVVAHIVAPSKKASSRTLDAKTLASFVKGKSRVSLSTVMERFNCTEREASYEMGRVIDERLVEPDVFTLELPQTWLDEALLEASEELLESGKLKTILTGLQPDAQTHNVDYVQLRIGLLRHGRSWGSLKPLN